MDRVQNGGLRLKHRVAVIGAGWAGAAAALTLARADVAVTVFEAAKIVGGRARRVEKTERSFDNGQHILLGAYDRSLALIASLHGEHVDHVLERRSLSMRMAAHLPEPLVLRAGAGPAPLHLATGLLAARGLTISEKVATCLWATKYLLCARPAASATVSELINEQPRRVRALLWEPLCVAALNTPAERASAGVFIEVLRRSFLPNRSASDMMLPRVDLSALLPEPALAEVVARGNTVLTSSVVMALRNEDAGVSLVTRDAEHAFDQVIIATGPQHVARLLESFEHSQLLRHALESLHYEPISTLHYEFSAGMDPTDAAMLMLDGAPGQWLFAQRLPNGRVRTSVVISAHHRADDEADLLRNGLAQLRQSFALPEPIWSQLITEKRATYSCTPAQVELLSHLPRAVGEVRFAGDWCVPELPATLESAVISGERAAQAIIQSLPKLTR
ncbi:MAG: FAD-dependent oxidoreductase [Betaproteobacteria bacterium]|nr:MAG: FAD-dependent oxidoreductase [Betaproteobacteria bacterium]